MQPDRISQLIQMISIGISDTTAAASPCRSGEMAQDLAPRDLDRMTRRHAMRLRYWHFSISSNDRPCAAIKQESFSMMHRY
jgi:hypothetical protein